MRRQWKMENGKWKSEEGNPALAAQWNCPGFVQTSFWERGKKRGKKCPALSIPTGGHGKDRWMAPSNYRLCTAVNPINAKIRRIGMWCERSAVRCVGAKRRFHQCCHQRSAAEFRDQSGVDPALGGPMACVFLKRRNWIRFFTIEERQLLEIFRFRSGRETPVAPLKMTALVDAALRAKSPLPSRSIPNIS